VLLDGIEICFARHSFKWSNNAARNAGVTCVIVGLAQKGRHTAKQLFYEDFTKQATHINAYLLDGEDIVVESRSVALTPALPKMLTGSVPNDEGNLILNLQEVEHLRSIAPGAARLIHPFFGSQDYLHGANRSCLLIEDDEVDFARSIPDIARRLDAVRFVRLASIKRETREALATMPHRFQHRAPMGRHSTIIIPSVSSENREWFPAGLLARGTVVSNLAFMLTDSPLWNLALIVSRLHLVWIATVCGKLKTDYRYSNTLGWNTFPVPPLTEQNKVDLTRCAEDILLAREVHFPATIADLYRAETDEWKMPADLRAAHEANDETLERIYIGRRFRNDTDRLEKLFEMYTTMTGNNATAPKPAKHRRKTTA
jgi:hypothetical protein